MTTAAFQHEPGVAMECLSIPITLEKEAGMDQQGRQVMKCGFKIGGGIDQDYMKSPQGYTDNGIYCTELAHRASQNAIAGPKGQSKIVRLKNFVFSNITHRKSQDF
ncbi:unnamed protein product, partial [Meganyctiphanes norvegica]